MIDFSIFRGRKVLITGHTGFKGSWLLAILEKAGAEVQGISLPPAPNSHFEALGLDARHSGIAFTDIRDYKRISSLISAYEPEIVFHLAAQPLVRESYVSTRDTFEVNFMGGVNLLEIARNVKSIRAFVFVTSDKAYENVEWEWGYRENDRLGGIDPYSASKGAVEIAVSSYSRAVLSSHDLSLATARAGNVIGGGDWSKDRIVPDIMRAILDDKPAQIRNPGSTRPWQHVLEPLSGYLLLAQRMLEKEVPIATSYNFGPDLNSAYTVLELANGLVKICGKGSVAVEPDSAKLHEATLLQLNCDRAKQQLDWSPRWDFDQTLFATGNWYSQFSLGKDVNELTGSQIDSYFKELA